MWRKTWARNDETRIETSPLLVNILKEGNFQPFSETCERNCVSSFLHYQYFKRKKPFFSHRVVEMILPVSCSRKWCWMTNDGLYFMSAFGLRKSKCVYMKISYLVCGLLRNPEVVFGTFHNIISYFFLIKWWEDNVDFHFHSTLNEVKENWPVMLRKFFYDLFI